jgi:XTP/dITP diphosphohydrolase
VARRIVVATGNAHKAQEIRAILAPLGIEVEMPESLPDTPEPFPTFAGNAIFKAGVASTLLGSVVLADDSGLVVDALGGEPGVRSARYAGPDATDAENNRLLVERLAAIGAQDPTAAFVCHVAVVGHGRVLAQAEGRVEGVIRWPAKGGGGFGYDPLFHHPESGCRLSELTAEQKNAISHRGRALRALAKKLESIEF